MDELQISGKRFISSRKIAKDNGYHTDYIGQLIRGGKIKGQKVGRTWYVDEASFVAYLSSDGGTPVESAAASEVGGPAVAPIAVHMQAAKEASVQAPATVAEERMDEVPQVHPAREAEEQRAEPPVASVAGAVAEETEKEKEDDAETTPIVVHKAPAPHAGLRYVSDNEPLLPEIPKKAAVTSIMPKVAPKAVEHRVEQPSSTETEEVEYVEPAPRASGNRWGVVGLIAAGTCAFIFAAVIGSSMFGTLEVREDGTAAAGYVIHW